jgi:hypothetical protein
MTEGIRIDVHGQPIVLEGNAAWLVCSLRAVSVGELVILLLNGKRTGRLEVNSSTGVRSLYFEGGGFAGATSTNDDDRLGESMWRAGRISLDQLMIASEMLKSEGKQLGRSLIDLGFIDPASLRDALIEQAVGIFEAVCLIDDGIATFVADQRHKTPLRLGVAGKKLLENALDKAREHREVLRKLGSLDSLVQRRATASPGLVREESQQAIMQLISHARAAKPMRELIAASSLGLPAGARAVADLLHAGHLERVVVHDAASVAKLCDAITLVMTALDEGGFGVGDVVRELFDAPPPEHEDALGGLSLAQPLVVADVMQQAQFLSEGTTQMVRALQMVLDVAITQARDTLPPSLSVRVEERAKALVESPSAR